MIRPLEQTDIKEIGNNLVESRTNGLLVPTIANSIFMLSKPAYTYLKDGKIVACCGAIKNGNDWEIWALYSKAASCFTRCKAAIEFRKKLSEIGGKCKISIPSDLPNGEKYAKFLGGKFVCKEVSKIWTGIENSIYEVTYGN